MNEAPVLSRRTRRVRVAFVLMLVAAVLAMLVVMTYGVVRLNGIAEENRRGGRVTREVAVLAAYCARLHANDTLTEVERCVRRELTNGAR